MVWVARPVGAPDGRAGSEGETTAAALNERSYRTLRARRVGKDSAQWSYQPAAAKALADKRPGSVNPINLVAP